jgi:membrane protein
MATTAMNRGREANRPSEIPLRGWKDTLMRVKEEIREDRLSMIAAAMSYYALFAFVPALTSVILIYAWVSDPVAVTEHIEKVSRLMPAETQEILRDQLTALASKASSTLGVGAIGSLLLSLFMASKGSKAIMEAMNVIYNEREGRGLIKFNVMALTMTLLGTVLSLVALAVIAGIPAFFGQFDLPPLLQTGVTAGSWLVLLSLFSFFLAFAYRYGPNREKAKWRWVSWGSIIAALLWAVASAGFSWYAMKFGNFNKTYGSLGAIIVLMLWFYISSFVMLLGGEINAELEHQTAKDSTEGQPMPMGDRGAQMADTVGVNPPKDRQVQ